MAGCNFPIILQELLEAVGDKFHDQVLNLTAKDRYDAVVRPLEFLNARFCRTRARPKYIVTKVRSKYAFSDYKWNCKLIIGPFYVNEVGSKQQKSMYEAALHFSVEFMKKVDLFKIPEPKSLYFDREIVEKLLEERNAEWFFIRKFKFMETKAIFSPIGRAKDFLERLGAVCVEELCVGSTMTWGKANKPIEARRQASIRMLHLLGFIEHQIEPIAYVIDIPEEVETEVKCMMNKLHEKCTILKVPFMVEVRAIEGMDSECRIFAMDKIGVGIGAGNRLAEFEAAKKILRECGYADNIAKLEQQWRPVPAAQNESTTMAPKPEVKPEESEVAPKAVECSKAKLYNWKCKIVMGNRYVIVFGGSETVKRKAAKKMLLPLASDWIDSRNMPIEDKKRPRAYLKLICDVDSTRPKNEVQEVMRKMLKMAGYLNESILDRLVKFKTPEKKVVKNMEAPLKEAEAEEPQNEVSQQILIGMSSLTETEPEEAKAEATEEKANVSDAGKFDYIDSFNKQMEDIEFMKICPAENSYNQKQFY